MRIWSLHPKYLDSKRLVAQWREALLCRTVLDGKTTGYKNHPQFLRVKNHTQPYYFINSFLYEIWVEGKLRGYQFNKDKLVTELVKKYGGPLDAMEVTDGQLEYEFNYIQNKLGEFHEQYTKNQQEFNEIGIQPNPCFFKTVGDIMNFEKIKT